MENQTKVSRIKTENIKININFKIKNIKYKYNILEKANNWEYSV